MVSLFAFRAALVKSVLDSEHQPGVYSLSLARINGQGQFSAAYRRNIPKKRII
jgi:hypothetical protein